MGRRVIKLGEFFFEWSTIVDAPVTDALTREQMVEHLTEQAREEAHRRCDNAERTTAEDAEDVSGYNRAGQNETTASVDYILKTYRAVDE